MSLPSPTPLAGGRIGYDVHDFLATLKDADLVQVSWSEDGERKGFDVFIPQLRNQPNTIVLDVCNQREACALRAAKIKIDTGDCYDATCAHFTTHACLISARATSSWAGATISRR
jgi:hypothetical protein